MTKLITKRAATALAEKALSGGHFVCADGVWVNCPYCSDKHRVVIYQSSGIRLTHVEMRRQLVERIHDCDVNAKWDG